MAWQAIVAAVVKGILASRGIASGSMTLKEQADAFMRTGETSGAENAKGALSIVGGVVGAASAAKGAASGASTSDGFWKTVDKAVRSDSSKAFKEGSLMREIQRYADIGQNVASRWGGSGLLDGAGRMDWVASGKVGAGGPREPDGPVAPATAGPGLMDAISSSRYQSPYL